VARIIREFNQKKLAEQQIAVNREGASTKPRAIKAKSASVFKQTNHPVSDLKKE